MNRKLNLLSLGIGILMIVTTTILFVRDLGMPKDFCSFWLGFFIILPGILMVVGSVARLTSPEEDDQITSLHERARERQRLAKGTQKDLTNI
jgi:hypothetical protein